MGRHSQARRTCAAAVGSLLLGAGLAGAEPADGQGLFPPQATVVLLVGVPGDVESEGNYRDQLQSWLELATGSGQAARVFVLCDEPSAVTVAGTPDGKNVPKEAEVSTNHPPDSQSPVTNHASRVPLHPSQFRKATAAPFSVLARRWPGEPMRWW